MCLYFKREQWLTLCRLEKEKQDIERFRNMTEDERKLELKINPKKVTNAMSKGKYKFMQKYYHRGVFYMVSRYLLLLA